MTFNILSLDGGGTFCAVQACALQHLFPGQSGHQVLGLFDLVAGTSGGSFVAAALAANVSPDKLVQLFHERKNRERFFRRLPWYRRLADILSAHHLGPRFDSRSKQVFIGEATGAMGQRALCDLWTDSPNGARRPHFMIVSYDYQFDKAQVFRSNWNSQAASFPRAPLRLKLHDAVHASTHAPVRWFGGVAKPTEGDHFGYWDGAMTGFNNPVLLAVTEAIAAGIPRDQIRVLSIGTACTQLLPADTDAATELRVESPTPCLVRDLGKTAKTIIAEPPDIDTYLAHLCLSAVVPEREGQCVESPIVRLNPVIHPRLVTGKWTAPKGFTLTEFKALVNLDISATADSDVELIDRLCANWVTGDSHNQAVRRRHDYFTPDPSTRAWNQGGCCEIGDLYFSQAIQRWREISV
ncbi:patatin-like phospholipase family protein [Roseateles koreensis]|uniref:Patatin-like phospholipase family protein n=1 Tax=Roseateles koreensis TaxID=2987526 RepID=A0ABT5KLX2_9BURK|nr:patatin-like phospholipase family protein [Roseateles koreensis]MDC8783911.1 patatin-like phospholipase family protein [Roseateles koreensis]